jgi:hypothetical protein
MPLPLKLQAEARDLMLRIGTLEPAYDTLVKEYRGLQNRRSKGKQTRIRLYHLEREMENMAYDLREARDALAVLQRRADRDAARARAIAAAPVQLVLL